MKRESRDELIKKGWSEDDISHAESIIEGRKLHDKSGSTQQANRILFWGILFVMVIGNALVSFGLIPVLLAMNHIGADLFMVISGFAVGLLFNFLIWDIEDHLTKKHHVLAATIIPLFAVLNLYMIVTVSNAINNVFQITEIRDNPFIISAFYVIAFLIPYLWTLFVKKKIKGY